MEECNRQIKNQRDKNLFTLFIIGVVMFAASFLLLFLSRSRNGMAEWYASHIYQKIVSVVGRISGVAPFSVVEILLYIVILIAVLEIVRIVIRLVHRQKIFESLKKDAVVVWMFVAVLFLLYMLNCGINYQKEGFAKSEGIEVTEYSLEELTEVCEILTEEVNEYADQVPRDEQGLMILEGEEKNQAILAMEKLGKTYSSLEGYYPRPKAVMGSWILSIQNTTGVYSPFTVEANYNQDMLAYNIPFTMCHELSHLRGFMEEKEANFIGYLACRESDNISFRYSASLMGWIYCTNVLYKLDHDKWEELIDALPENVRKDLNANNAFWKKYDGKVAEVSNRINDNYLKANGQAEGVTGYDRMVDLMMAYFRMQENQ